MAKAQVKQTKGDAPKVKDRKEKNGDAMIGRVKKVVKKSRRKLSEEKFEKQLQRTIAFLEELQSKINETNNTASVNRSVKQKKTVATKKAKTSPRTGGTKH
jgi:DNA-binding transcriptional regulator GbsR (MarR family)